MPFVSVNPATGDRLADYPAATVNALTAAVAHASIGFARFSTLTVADRCAMLVRWADALLARKNDLARLATLEMGKPIRQSHAEVDRCSAGLRAVASEAAEWLAPRHVALPDGSHGSVYHEPLGVLLGVMPWNFPYWQVVRFAVGALAAGNALLIKPAPNTAGCALLLEETARLAGFPDGTYQTVLAEIDQLELIVASPEVAGVSLTGSVRAGRSLAALAGRYGKPAVLELGGSDPFIVLDDADLPAAARDAAAARALNSGQSCISAKRFIVHTAVYERFRDLFAQALQNLRIGDPLDDTTDVGPLARLDLRDQLAAQLATSLARGATPLVPGGPIAGHPGAYFAPALLEAHPDLLPLLPAWCEETFGPLALLTHAASDDHAVALANDTPFGLGASLYTANPHRSLSLAARIRCGNVFLNATTSSHPLLPFGGLKSSGLGRELGPEGTRWFTNTKTVVVSPTRRHEDAKKHEEIQASS